jgi:hypothetical protein
MQQQTGYSLEDIKKCVKDLHALLLNDQTKYLAVRRKFAEEKNHKVSKIPPVQLPLGF